MNRNGFTLIELVVVIVILGIIAVTAAPRFLNVQDDARNAALEGLKGAIHAGLSIGYGKMAVAGLESVSYITNKATDDGNYKAESIPIPECEKGGAERCIFRYGYPESDFYTLTTLVDGINKHYDQDKDWGITRIENDNALIITEKNNLDYAAQQPPPLLIRDNCYIRYQHPESANAGYTLEIIPCE